MSSTGSSLRATVLWTASQVGTSSTQTVRLFWSLTNALSQVTFSSAFCSSTPWQGSAPQFAIGICNPLGTGRARRIAASRSSGSAGRLARQQPTCARRGAHREASPCLERPVPILGRSARAGLPQPPLRLGFGPRASPGSPRRDDRPFSQRRSGARRSRRYATPRRPTRPRQVRER